MKDKSDHLERLILVKATLEAIASMHKNSVYHGDIKTNNLFFNKQGKAQFIDFGFASTRSSSFITYCDDAYLATNIAPERAVNQELYEEKVFSIYSTSHKPFLNKYGHNINTAAADVFSIGIFLTEFLGNRRILAKNFWVPLPSGSPSDLKTAIASIKKNTGE